MEITRPVSKQPIPAHAQLAYKGQLFDVYQWEQELFDGTKAVYERLKRPDTVIVFAVQDDGKIILTEQEQPGALPFIGAAGGRIEPGEDPLTAAKREFLEETGYEADRYELWDAQQPVGKIEWAVFTFVAKGIRKVAEQNLDAGERIKLKPVSLDELIEIGTGKNFSEKEIVPHLLRAKYDMQAKMELQKLFAV